ncbi:hypothetical protein EDF44_0825 [Rathayibacter sp. PhB185]|nr:hypothetical protein EDF45_0825 [Rathayibacter sp. PhB186]ROS55681.1 hypothetical protein EDF44_0825 [Rathayibacter sp. PhB185]
MTRVELFRGGACGRSAEFVRLRRGVHVRAAEWAGASVDARHRARIDAVAATWGRPVFLRESAAAVWGLPLVEPLEETVHVAASPAVGSRSRNRVAEHRGVSSDSVVVVDGLTISDLAQTVLDLCRFSSFRRAVTAADHALRMRGSHGEHLLELEELRERLAVLPGGARGRAAAARAIDFADERADSPLESISRVAMHQAGLPRPVLQRPFHDDEGLIGPVDFFFEDAGVIGEADGRTSTRIRGSSAGAAPSGRCSTRSAGRTASALSSAASSAGAGRTPTPRARCSPPLRAPECAPPRRPRTVEASRCCGTSRPFGDASTGVPASWAGTGRRRPRRAGTP